MTYTPELDQRQPCLDLFGEKRQQCEAKLENVQQILSQVSNILLNGYDLILDRIFDRIRSIMMSIDKVLNLAKTVTTIEIKLPLNKSTISRTMLMLRHQKIAKLFDENFWVTR